MRKNDYVDIFRGNITYLRKINNLSLKRMSEILNVSVYSLKNIEKGILPPKLKVDILFKVQSYFRISPQIILDKKLSESKFSVKDNSCV